MNRRGFLQLLGAAAVGLAVPDLTLDPERALWVPGAKRIFDLGRPSLVAPDAEYWYRPSRNNQLVTPDWVTREALKALKKQLEFSQFINRAYDDVPRVGFTVNVRLPDRFGPDGRPLVVLRPGEEFITIAR